MGVTYTVFTKPWKTMPLPDLARFVHNLGFHGIELPVRPGFQVEPERVTQDLPKAVKILADFDVRIGSIAGPTDEKTIAACAEAGIPIIRIMANIGPDGYRATEVRYQQQFDAMVPLLDKHQVTVGVQNHSGRDVCNAMGLHSLIGKYDRKHIAAVWDAAHNALQGEEPELALEIVWPHLCLVNLKNAYWQRVNGPEAQVAQWRIFWTSGRHGLASWPRVAAELKRRKYEGALCLSAEYSDHDSVDRLIAEDIRFAKSLFEAQ